MVHIDPDEVALIALGEPAGSTASEHLTSCPVCQAELADLSSLVALGRRSDPAELLVSPPAGVWEAIAADLGSPTGLPSWPDPQDSPARSDIPSSQPGALHEPSPQPAAATSPARQPSRWRNAGSLALAAAVGAILGTGVTTLVNQSSEQPSTNDPVIAQAVLAPISTQATQAGTATASNGPDGLEVRVDARGLPALDGFYEVWLLDKDATRLFALGALPAGSVGTFTVPPGVSLSDFPVVDISLEPYDGDPNHSHDSLLRGTLEV